MYQPKTAPYKHQATGFALSERSKVFAYTMEQRTGKTKLTLDITAAAYERGTIDGLLVAAPKGVDKQWAEEEVATHLPDRIPRLPLVLRVGKVSTKKFQAEFAALLAFKGLAILASNHEAFRTPTGQKLIEKFLRKRRTLFALDESSCIKTPGAAQTRGITRLGKLAVARRILDGTPNAENPLELFSQYRFLDPNILGFTAFTAFRARYAKMEQGSDPRSGRHFDKVVGYAHIDELQAKIAPYTYRVRRDEVFDMPAKVYQKIWYELSDEQRRVYDSLRDTYRAELISGERITVTSVLSRLLRLQQVLSNKMPGANIILCTVCSGEGCDACNHEGIIDNGQRPTLIDPNNNPRLKALITGIDTDPTASTLVWTRFKSEADDVIQLAHELKRKPCRYDGSVNDKDRTAAKLGFQAGDFDFFVGSAAAAGRGLTLSKGELCIYYSNYFALRPRLQSEDRTEAPGKTKGTGVIDIMAEDTVDVKIVDTLRAKRSLSDAIQGDPAKDWL